jgi:hypothetical protein
MTVKQGLRRIIFKKCAVLLVVAMLLGAMCYYTSSHEAVPNYNNMHFIYTLASIGISLIILVFLAWKRQKINLYCRLLLVEKTKKIL